MKLIICRELGPIYVALDYKIKKGKFVKLTRNLGNNRSKLSLKLIWTWIENTILLIKVLKIIFTSINQQHAIVDANIGVILMKSYLGQPN